MAEVWGDRQAEFQVMLTTPQGSDIGLLEGVESGSVTLSATSRLRASGRLWLTETSQQIDWLRAHCRVYYEPQGLPGWPVGTFVMSAPTTSVDDHQRTREVELLSMLSYVDRDAFANIWTVEKRLVLPQDLCVLARRSGARVVGDYTQFQQRKSAEGEYAYDAGTSVLTVVNDLLASIGYAALRPDGWGTLHAAPYVRPARRPTVFTFSEGDRAVHSASWTIDRDVFNVPSKVVCVGAGDSVGAPLVGVAENTDPSSPYSTPSRGRPIVHVETGVKATSQTDINTFARRLLIEKSTPAATLVIKHMPVRISPGEVVGFESQGVRMRCVVQEMEYSLSPTGLVRTTLKEVKDL